MNLKDTLKLVEKLSVLCGIGFSVATAIMLLVVIIFKIDAAWVLTFVFAFLSVAGYTLTSATNVVLRMFR